MTTAERFWFALGWALGDDQVAPDDAVRVMDEVASALRDEPPDRFAAFVVQYIYEPNEMRGDLLLLADRLAWERSAAHAIADGEEALDAFFRSEEAEGR